MGCGSSQDPGMESLSKRNKQIAREQLNILTRSLLAALYTHHAATKWFEIAKRRAERIKFEKRLLFEHFGDSDDEDSKVPLVRITSCSEYSPEKETEMSKTPSQQLELFTGSLMSALYTYHAAMKWYHKWKRAPVRRSNKTNKTWLVKEKAVDSGGLSDVPGSEKKSAREQLDLFTRSLLSALYTYHAAKKWYHHGSRKSSLTRLQRSPHVPNGTKKSATENLDVVTESLLSALYTYHAAMKWQQATTSPALTAEGNSRSLPFLEDDRNLHPPLTAGDSSSVGDVKKRAREHLDAVTGSLLSALYTYHSASTWYDEWQQSPPKGPPHQPKQPNSYHPQQKKDKPPADNLFIESQMKTTTAKEQLDLLAGSLLSALYTYHATTEWHASVFDSSKKKEPMDKVEQVGPKKLQPGEQECTNSTTGAARIPFGDDVEDANDDDDCENKNGPEDADCEIATVTLLTTLLTYRAANKWHNRICKATVELLQELGFGENEGVEGVPGGDNSDSQAFQDGGLPKTTAEELDIAISRLLAGLNSKLEERSSGVDGSAGGIAEEDGGTEVMPIGSNDGRRKEEEVVDVEPDSENEEEILTMVTEFVDGDEGGAKYYESITSTVHRRNGSLMDGMTM